MMSIYYRYIEEKGQVLFFLPSVPKFKVVAL